MYGAQELNVSGKRSIAFMGREIAAASNRETTEETRMMWDSVRAYEVDPDWASKQERNGAKKIDPYIIGIAKCTKWIGTRDRYRVFYARTLIQVLDIVRRHIPVFHREIEEQLKLDTGALDHEPSRSGMV